ncbi:MAG: hypothetical protein KatS3mg058_2701 [Roseiflexus sp.]|nr:MAG: hypothetical protein KatS3mg058_2701 [Roseiflexus sp.]
MTIKKTLRFSWALRAEALAEIMKAPAGLSRPERGLSPAQRARDLPAQIYWMYFTFIRLQIIPMTIEDAACWSFRALRFAQGKRSEESERVAHDPSRCSG